MTIIKKIREAINYNRPKELKEALSLISSEELIQANQEDRNKFLAISAKHNSKAMITALIDKGIDINTTNKQNETVLHQLLKHTPNKINHEFILFLLDKGTNINLKDEQNRSALFFILAKTNSVKELEEVKIASHYELDFNMKDKKGNNLIHFSTFHNYNIINLLDYLVLKGVAINELNDNQENVLRIAVLKRDVDVVAKLIKQYNVKADTQDVVNALNLSKDEVLVELMSSSKFNLNELNEKEDLIYNCLCFGMKKSLEYISHLPNNPMWNKENVEKAIEQYREQFGNIFEIDEHTVNHALEFAKVSLVYFEKQQLENLIIDTDLIESKKAKL